EDHQPLDVAGIEARSALQFVVGHDGLDVELGPAVTMVVRHGRRAGTLVEILRCGLHDGQRSQEHGERGSEGGDLHWKPSLAEKRLSQPRYGWVRISPLTETGFVPQSVHFDAVFTSEPAAFTHQSPLVVAK